MRALLLIIFLLVVLLNSISSDRPVIIFLDGVRSGLFCSDGEIRGKEHEAWINSRSQQPINDDIELMIYVHRSCLYVQHYNLLAARPPLTSALYSRFAGAPLDPMVIPLTPIAQGLVLAYSIRPILWTIRTVYRRLRCRCTKCGYLLRGLPLRRCPECGKQF